MSSLGRNQPLRQKILHRVFHRLHTKTRAGLDHRVDLRQLILADKVADGIRADHDFKSAGAPAIRGWQQRLGDDGLTDHEIARLTETAEHITLAERRAMAAERDGSALAYISAKPVSFERVLAWIATLGQHNLVLAPASAIVKSGV